MDIYTTTLFEIREKAIEFERKIDHLAKQLDDHLITPDYYARYMDYIANDLVNYIDLETELLRKPFMDDSDLEDSNLSTSDDAEEMPF